jgi:hypothetical protein
MRSLLNKVATRSTHDSFDVILRYYGPASAPEKNHFPRGKMSIERDGSAGTRTRNQRLKRALLYRLSYRPCAEHHFLMPARFFNVQ